MEPDATRPMADTDAASDETAADQPVGRLIGRYVVLGELGRGGEGRVFEAFDTELERKVALKVLGSGAPAARREARAQAKLHHPAVVSIFEVGDANDQAYIAMELMEPRPFADWAAQASVHEVLDALRRIALGVHAAHCAELVHGDIKPSNILRARTGEPKLSDFGVARGTAETIDTLAGTRAFMAPELLAGGAGTPASDQYAFCLTAWALFHGASPPQAAEDTLQQSRPEGTADTTRTGSMAVESVVTWTAQGLPDDVVAALQRGSDPDPTQRWPDMAALEAALRPSAPASRDASRLLWPGGLLLAAGGVAAGLYGGAADAEDPCRDAAAPMTRAWDAAHRTAALDPLRAPGFERVAERTQDTLDAYARDWSAQAEASCRATHVQRSQSDAMLDLRGACLRERLTAFEATTTALAGSETAPEHAHQLTDALPDLPACVAPSPPEGPNALPDDPAQREAIATARAQLQRLETLRIVRDDEAANALWATVLPTVEALEHAPLLLEARLEAAHLRRAQGEYDDALASARDALALAVTLSRPDAVRELAALLAGMVSYEQQKPEAAEAYAALLRPMVDAPALDAQALAASLDALATYEAGATHYEQALALSTRATEAYRTRVGTDNTYYGSLLNNRALILDHAGQTEASVAAQREAIEVRRAVLGPRHPDVAQSLDNLAQALINAGQLEQALAATQEALDIYAAVAPKHANAAVAFNTLGNAYAGLGRWPEALQALDDCRALMLETLGPDHAYMSIVEGGRGVVLMELGRIDEALAAFEASVDLETRLLGKRHPQLVNTRANYGDVLVKAGRIDAGLRVLREAHGLGVDVLGAGHVDTVYVATLLALRLYRLDRFDEAQAVADGALSDSAAGPGGRPGDLKSLRSVADGCRRKLGHG